MEEWCFPASQPPRNVQEPQRTRTRNGGRGTKCARIVRGYCCSNQRCWGKPPWSPVGAHSHRMPRTRCRVEIQTFAMLRGKKSIAAFCAGLAAALAIWRHAPGHIGVVAQIAHPYISREPYCARFLTTPINLAHHTQPTHTASTHSLPC